MARDERRGSCAEIRMMQGNNRALARAQRAGNADGVHRFRCAHEESPPAIAYGSGRWRAGNHDFIGAPYSDRPRTLDRLIKKIMAWFKGNPLGHDRLLGIAGKAISSQGIDKGEDIAA